MDEKEEKRRKKNISPFDLAFPKDALKVGFLSKGKETGMYAATDFSYLENAGDFFHVYHVFRRYFQNGKA